MKQTSHPPHLLRALGVLAPLTLALAGCAEAPDSSSPEHSAEAKQNLTTCVTLQRGVGTSVVDDVRITQSQPALNLNNQTLMIDKFSEALIKFTLPALPQSAVLNSATMTLYPTVAGGGPINIHSVLQPWSETGVTFASFNQKFAPAIAAVFAPTASATLKSVDITALAQAWISGAQANNGLLLETTSTVATYIMPSEAGVNSLGVNNSGLRPSLKLCYITPTNNCAPNPCQNGASCQNLANGFTCACPPGFTGATCQTNIDDCAGNPCQNGGACTDGLNSYTCACPPGFAGANCQTDINECAPAPCQNGGVCTDGINSYTCACPAGYTGQNCQTLINNCASAPCQNGGSCTNGVNSYSCACATGFSGQNCQVNIDDCVGNACKNGSTCIDGIAAYTCSCPPGYNGNLCQINIDDCAGAPCLNGGSCNDGIFSYSCSCAAGYTGTNCQIDINDCAGNPCQNGGMCVDGVNSYACQCAPGYSGTQCEIDLCQPDPCQNGGTCSAPQGTATCACPPGFSGTQCEVSIVPMDFGGMWGTIEGALQVNPATGAASCPAGYTATAVRGTPGYDYDASYCWRGSVAGQDPFYDFGGMWGYVNNQLAPNMLTYAAACPAGYTDLEVAEASGSDYPLHVCYKAHQAGTLARRFGGMYGVVNDAPANNPATGASTCPPGYTANQVLGSSGIDHPMYYCDEVCPVGFVGLQCEIPVAPMEFGGMWGVVEGQLQNNPATGAPSCPAGYTTTTLFDNPGLDNPAYYCWRGHVAGQEALYDFGGMWGYVNNQLVENPVTAASSCPAGYTTQQVSGSSGDDYSLYLCYQPHVPGATGPLLGGLFGTIHGFPGANPATSASSCPAGYTASQVLGTPGIDGPVSFCYQACPAGFVGAHCEIAIVGCNTAPCQNGSACTDVSSGHTCACLPGFIGSNCEIPVLPMQFGGMWGFVEGVEQANPATGTSSCPAGYTTTTILDNPGLDYAAHYCWRGVVAGQTPLYDFGGMWGYVNNQLVMNAVTGTPACPAGYTAQQVNGSSGSDYSFFVCYQPHVAGTTGPLLGGLLGSVNGVPQNNPATGAASCPPGYTQSQVLGTQGIDSAVSYCYQP